MFGVIFRVVILKINKLITQDGVCLHDSVKALYHTVSAYTFFSILNIYLSV